MYRSPHNKESWIYQRFGIKGSGWAVGWHTGCDSVAGENTDVVSVADGKVIVAGTGTYGASYGKMVFIKNNDGVGVLYAHLNSVTVSAGQTVKAGQKIGTEGRSGSIGAREHLHLEIHTDGVYHYAQHVDDAQKYIDYSKYGEGDDLTMAQYEELKGIIEKLQADIAWIHEESFPEKQRQIDALTEAVHKLANPMIYNYVDENMPEWARDTVQKLVDKGILKGNENGELGLDDGMLRMLVMLDRGNCFK